MQIHSQIPLPQGPVDRRWRGQLTIILLCFCLLLLAHGTAEAAGSRQAVTPPEAVADSATTDEDTPVTIDVLANDISQEGSLVIVAVGEPQSGTAEIVANQIRYTPAANFSGDDSFFYSVHNGDPANTRQATVRVTVSAVNDGPADLLLSNDTVAENIALGATVGAFTAVGGSDANFSDSLSRSTFALVGSNNDNDNFRIVLNALQVNAALDFETKANNLIDVQVHNPQGQTFTKRLTIKVTNANDAPHAINLSNNRLDENQPAGVTVGTLSSQDVDAGNRHTYALVDGTGSTDNALFRVEGNTLKTNALLDFETKPIFSVRIASTDNNGGTFAQIFLVNVNNIPSPPDAGANTLELCTGDPISLVNQGSGITKVLVQIVNVTISNKTANGCTVTGVMNLTTNGATVNNLPFSGTVNERDQFSNASIPDFTINMAGLPLVARGVEITYLNERPSLHITRPLLQMPQEFGGLSNTISAPTFIDSGGIRIAGGAFDLPSILTESGFGLSLSAELKLIGSQFVLDADGALTIPNIGKKKAPGDEGQECTISAGVTISAGPDNATVMVIAAGEARTQELMGPFRANAAPAAIMAPDAFDAFRLEKVRAGFSCSPGLPIANTGLFLTGLSGEITLISGAERVDVTVTIEAGKSLPGIGPILALDGSMGLQPQPFELDLGVALSVLSIEVARTEARITTNSFRASIRFQALFFNGNAEINAFSRNGRATFTGSARVSLEIKKEAIVKAGKCFLRVFLCPPAIPPFSVGPLATVGADVGEFTNGNFGFKGFVKVLIFGTHGFFVDHTGKFKFGSVDSFKLVSPPSVAAARTTWQDAINRGEIVGAASADGEYIFLQNVNGIEGNNGVIISAPLSKPAVQPGQVQAADVITQVNLIQHGDVIFNMVADAPFAFTLITPQGQEVTPDNYDQSAALGYNIEYMQTDQYELVTNDEPVDESDKVESASRLLFTPLSAEAVVNNVDLRIDGAVVYVDVDFQNSHEWLKPLPLAPGDHLIELLTTGTNNVVRSAPVNLPTAGNVSVISVGGATPAFVTITDDNAAPATFGKAKIRFFNGSNTALTLLVNGAPTLNNVGYKTASDYVETDAGAKSIELRTANGNTLATLPLATELADGGVYTFLSTDFSSSGFPVTLIQREDARYQHAYLTYYTVDQARMNEQWQMKLVGDTDNTFYQLSVMGPDSPPILGSVAVDAANPAATQVSWQLTSDNRPTRISVFANPGAISASLPLTNADGSVDFQEIPLYQGTLVAEYEISDLAELGGKLVTKQLDLNTLPSGAYHLWVRADDGVNPPVETYAETPSVMAAGVQSVYGTNVVWIAKDDFNPMARVGSAAQVVIDHSADFPTTWTATISNTFDSTDKSLYIEWRANPHPDTDLYRLLFGNTPLNPTQVITVGSSIQEIGEDGLATGAEVGFVTLEDIQPGVTYFLAVEGVDTETGRTVRSQEFTFLVEPGSFTITSAQATVNVAAGSTVQVPVTLNVEEALFFPTVWLSADLGAAAPGITAQFVDVVDGVTGISPANPTHQLAISIDGSVPDGVYPIKIAGYSGQNKETLTIRVVVGAASELTETIYLPVVLR